MQIQHGCVGAQRDAEIAVQGLPWPRMRNPDGQWIVQRYFCAPPHDRVALLARDPILVLAGEERDPVVIEVLREKYRLNDPLPVQYFAWAWQARHGNFGISLRTNAPVLDLILEKLPVTLQLAAMAMTFALLIGIPAGVMAAVKKGTGWDYAATALALWGLSIPNFFLGIMLIFLISVQLNWLPASGYVSPAENLSLNLKTMIMPAFVLGNALAAKHDAPYPQRDAWRAESRTTCERRGRRACSSRA